MHSLLSVFNPLHSNINIYAYSPYFSLCSDKENLLNNQELFLLVIISSILMTLMFNLGMILWGEISSLSLFGVWGLEKVNVQIIENQGPVVQRPISSNPELNFNPAFFISLFKSLFGKIFTILFRTSNDQIASKKIWTEFSLKVFRPEIKFHTNPGLP